MVVTLGRRVRAVILMYTAMGMNQIYRHYWIYQMALNRNKSDGNQRKTNPFLMDSSDGWCPEVRVHSHLRILSCVWQSGWRGPAWLPAAWAGPQAGGICPRLPSRPRKSARPRSAGARLRLQRRTSRCGRCRSENKRCVLFFFWPAECTLQSVTLLQVCFCWVLVHLSWVSNKLFCDLH